MTQPLCSVQKGGKSLYMIDQLTARGDLSANILVFACCEGHAHDMETISLGNKHMITHIQKGYLYIASVLVNARIIFFGLICRRYFD